MSTASASSADRTTTDRIEKTMILRAPRSKVWRALTDPAEPMTLVVFELEEVPEGTRLTVKESGFDRITPARRAKVYRENDEGWTGQFKNLRKYLASA